MFLLIFDTALPSVVIALASDACLRKVSSLDSCCTYQEGREKQWEKFADRMDLLLSGEDKVDIHWSQLTSPFTEEQDCLLQG